MLKGALFIAAGAFAVALLATAVTGPAAMAADPKCKDKNAACAAKPATKRPKKEKEEKDKGMDPRSITY